MMFAVDRLRKALRFAGLPELDLLHARYPQEVRGAAFLDPGLHALEAHYGIRKVQGAQCGARLREIEAFQREIAEP